MRYLFPPFLAFCTAATGWWWPNVDDQVPDDQAPVVTFVDLDEPAIITEPLSYGSIQVEAFDPDAGSSNGDGVARVRMRIFDADTGQLVARRNEYRPTYDFGPALPDGTYRLEATARSNRSAGGSTGTATITIVLDSSAPTDNPPSTIPPSPGTVPTIVIPPRVGPTPTSPTTTSPTTTSAPTTVAPPSSLAPTTSPTTARPTTAAPTTAPSTTAAPTTAPATSPAGEIERAAAASLAALNDERAAVGLGPLTLNTGMSAFALDWSRQMSRTGFRHSSGPYGENIAWYSDESLSAEAAASYFNGAWVNSPGHYANMTNSRYTEVGIGLYRDESGWWATHVFR